MRGAHLRSEDRAPLPSGDEKVVVVRRMFDAIAPRYDLVNRIMTFGLDVFWRKRTVSSLGLDGGAKVVDVACGTGDLCTLIARAGMHPVGVDMSGGMLAANESGAPLVLGDAARLPFADATFDGATCGFALRNFADIDAVLGELGRVLRPGGRVALLEVGEPTAPVLRVGQRAWMSGGVPVLGSLLSDADAYRYLPRSVEYLPTRDGLRERMRRAGFATVNHHQLTGGIAQLFTATRSGLPGDAAGPSEASGPADSAESRDPAEPVESPGEKASLR